MVDLVTVISFAERLLDVCFKEHKCVILVGDLNINMRHSYNGLSNLLDVYGMKNIVSTPMCYRGI